MLIVDNADLLAEVCEKLNTAGLLSIDTEFMRRTTYFAKLSLVQIVTDRGYRVIIDALAVKDLSALNVVLQNNNIVKIFHAALQDLEIFYTIFKELPRNLFDTQVAARICGLGFALSYSDLCIQLCNTNINKDQQTADWFIRPLSKQMLDYAINDVMHLHQIYQVLSDSIRVRKLEKQYQKSIDELLNPENYHLDVEEAWKKVKFDSRSIDDKILTRLKHIASFREECAITLNIPRKHFASDRDLLSICRALPQDTKTLMRMQLEKQVLKQQAKLANRLFDLCATLKTTSP